MEESTNTVVRLEDVVKARTMGYVDRIRDCYTTKQQITGDGIVVSIHETSKNESSSSSTTKEDDNDDTSGDVVVPIQCLRGKVRDRYIPTNVTTTTTTDTSTSTTSNTTYYDRIALVTTDRQSGFDRQLAIIPYKGAVLNLCSQYWFELTKDIIINHMIHVPHTNITIAQQCIPFPIEFVVRSYMTGSTSTSIWKNYQNGVRLYCGHVLQDGMTKNQKLPQNLLTPTTKEEDHDRPISVQEIVNEQWMTQEDLDICSTAAMAIFTRGQEIALQHGLILVDTKYEFGRCCRTNRIMLIDEVHTPDSSRYWIANTYQDRISNGLEPENIDKEFLRLWFNDHCDPYNDAVLPDAPSDLVIELSRRYIQLYEMITGKQFDFDAVVTDEQVIARIIEENLNVAT